MKLLMLLLLLADSGNPAGPPDVQLLDFTASYCEPCRQMLPILQRMEHDKFPIRRVDITEDPDLSRKFQITGLPTLIVMVEGKEVKRFVGLTSEDELRQAMHKAARDLEQKRIADNPPAPPLRPEVATKTQQVNDNEKIEPKAPAAPASSRKSLADVFQRMFSGRKSAPDVIRGQSPGGDAAANGLVRSEAATVRVQVEGRSTKGGRKVREVGTGTIIHSVPGETLVLTCAHFFLNLQRDGSSVTVETFDDGRPEGFAATVVGGNHSLDLAIIRCTPKRTLPAVSVSAQSPELATGQSLVSFGCDLGNSPSRLEMSLVAVDRYLGPGNLVCTMDPVSGRSGGGLYLPTGELVGVCSCAEREKSEGLYMAWSAIASLLRELKLEKLLRDSTLTSDENSFIAADDSLSDDPGLSAEGSLADATPAPNSSLPMPAKPELENLEFDPLAESPEVAAADPEASADAASPLESDANTSPGKPVNPEVNAAKGPEITVIIDEKTPGSQKKVIVIPRASQWLLEMLTGESPGEKPVASYPSEF